MKVGYARTSLNEMTPENQINILIEAGIKRDHIFVDRAVSGIIDAKKRQAFQEMLRYIQMNSKDDENIIFVFELSRIGRTFIDVLTTIYDLEKEGIRVFSLSPKESWLNTTDKNIRQLIMAIFAWVAERERELLVERTKLGIERARAEGKRIGRPPKEINWKEFDAWKDKGLNTSAISRIMDVPYPTLIVKAKERKKGGDKK